MTLGPPSVRAKGRTARYVLWLLLGSVVVVATLTWALLRVTRDVLPPAPSSAPAPAPAPSNAAAEEPPLDPSPEAPDEAPDLRPASERLKACCAALRQNSETTPLQYKAAYVAAAAACRALVNSQDPDRARAEIRTLLPSARVPAACR